MNWNKFQLKWIEMNWYGTSHYCSGPIAWSYLSGLILCKHNLSISLHTDNLNVQLQLHVKISVFKLSVVLIEFLFMHELRLHKNTQDKSDLAIGPEQQNTILFYELFFIIIVLSNNRFSSYFP